MKSSGRPLACLNLLLFSIFSRGGRFYPPPPPPSRIGLNHLTKMEIDLCESTGYHKTEQLTEIFSKLKQKNLRLFRDTIKAMYGEGPYKISGEYSEFIIDYRNWQDADATERIEVTRKFLEAKPFPNPTSVPDFIIETPNPPSIEKPDSTPKYLDHTT